MSVVHLCQDYLALARLPQYEDEALCACGGDLCGCSSCARTARALLDGERDAYARGLRQPDEGLPFWCEATGIHRPPS